MGKLYCALLLFTFYTVLGRDAYNPKVVSVRAYYAYKLRIRHDDTTFLLYFGRLLEQYIVDNYVKLETQRLYFFRTQQEEIRQEFLQGVVDEMAKWKQRVLLLKHETKICRSNGLGTKVRVFHAKVEQLKHELFKNNIFGEICAYTYVIGFRKRGLPHAHFLLILETNCKTHTPEDFEKIKYHHKVQNPHLFRMVVQHMIHGPCCSLNPFNVCMKKKGSCKNPHLFRMVVQHTMHILYIVDVTMGLSESQRCYS
uniref:Helitron helicase-like domain-containing protein n=1 Tax=Lactuca sativa TaxID=4236 RepID=A0A9R1XSS2_LACSA|nr:hypothetical protein LSAT_V11C300117100 [Lactuca sativa]